MKTNESTARQLILNVKKVANLSPKQTIHKGAGITTLPTTLF